MPARPDSHDGCVTVGRLRMRNLTLYLVLTIATQTFCYGDVTKFATANPSDGGLSGDDRRAMQDSSRFHEVRFTSDLPPTIVALCAGDKARLADPGQKWQATDVIMEPNLPGKRLIWAEVGSDYYVVHYERGGIAHSFHILVAKLTKNDAQPKVVWRAVGGPLKDYAAFLDALRTGKLHDSLDYPH